MIQELIHSQRPAVIIEAAAISLSETHAELFILRCANVGIGKRRSANAITMAFADGHK
jgi:prepilin-type processing-associated H-X9-DG protein